MSDEPAHNTTRRAPHSTGLARMMLRPRTDIGFFRLLHDLGGRVFWDLMAVRTGYGRTVLRGHSPTDGLPCRVGRGTPDQFLEALCAAHVAFAASDLEKFAFSVFLRSRRPAEIAAYRLLATPGKRRPQLGSMRAALWRIVGLFQPNLRKPKGCTERCVGVCRINPPAVNRPPARAVYAARRFLAKLLSDNRVELWATAPEWFRVAGTP